jgi:hypothetical protein
VLPFIVGICARITYKNTCHCSVGFILLKGKDSGEYVCTAGNGIVGRDGKVKQTGTGYIIIIGM